MGHYADIAIYGRDGQLKLLVEAKSKMGTTPQWAARLRRNMLAHGDFPSAPYFLIAFPDRFYLWRQRPAVPEIVEPDLAVDASPVLRPFLERTSSPDIKVSERGLELAVSAWLDWVISGPQPDEISEDEQWVNTSGLLDAIRGGRVEAQMLV